MRTYQSGTKEKRKGSKKVLYGILLAFSIIALATIITLSLTLGKPPVDQTPPGGDPPVVGPPGGEDPPIIKPVFKMPMESYEFGQMASLNKVVFSSSMGYWRTHNGIDFLASQGTAVKAVSAGTVASVQHTVLEATVITVEHADGLVSIYKGLTTDVSVNVGDEVEAGTQLGSVAAVMPLERDDGAHLHLEMKLNGKFVDPANYLPGMGDK